jgi:hypothetical protein
MQCCLNVVPDSGFGCQFGKVSNPDPNPGLNSDHTYLFTKILKINFFVQNQCCGSGSGIRDPVPFWPLDPGSGIGFFRIPDPGSRIPDPKLILLRV